MKPAVPPLPAAKTLANQKSDFTAEGSPPPGKVSTESPARPPGPEPTGPAPEPVRGPARPKRRRAAGSP